MAANVAYDQLFPPFDPWLAFAHVKADLVRGLGGKCKVEDFYPAAKVEADERSDLEKLVSVFGPGRVIDGG